jgi:glutaredoxin
MKRLLILFSLFFAFSVNASAIPKGTIVKTANNPDVYIVKYNNGKQYKRLVLNPLVFKSYGHLKWENLLTVSQSEMDSFATSDLVKVDGTADVYQLMPNGDVGNKFLLTSNYGYDMDGVYTINSTDFNNYTDKGKSDENADSKIMLYYSDTCPHCINLGNSLAENGIRDKVAFVAKDVNDNSENSTDLMSKAALCGIVPDEIGVPFLWDGEGGNKCLMGDQDIANYFKSKVGGN